jgi:hypothetical protein
MAVLRAEGASNAAIAVLSGKIPASVAGGILHIT